ncbi:hypothetical protein F5Y13DRAFT_9697 [Hypoxylon sp. FL1857]|nr:hypothetical protein F5Y13DRAFT_9697 [Hypoxylon sp. FL1857]
MDLGYKITHKALLWRARAFRLLYAWLFAISQLCTPRVCVRASSFCAMRSCPGHVRYVRGDRCHAQSARHGGRDTPLPSKPVTPRSNTILRQAGIGFSAIPERGC